MNSAFAFSLPWQWNDTLIPNIETCISPRHFWDLIRQEMVHLWSASCLHIRGFRVLAYVLCSPWAVLAYALCPPVPSDSPSLIWPVVYSSSFIHKPVHLQVACTDPQHPCNLPGYCCALSLPRTHWSVSSYSERAITQLSVGEFCSKSHFLSRSMKLNIVWFW